MDLRKSREGAVAQVWDRHVEGTLGAGVEEVGRQTQSCDSLEQKERSTEDVLPPQLCEWRQRGKFFSLLGKAQSEHGQLQSLGLAAVE